MPTRNVNLTDHFDQFIELQIASGQYKNASKVMRAGLRLLEQQARKDEEKLTLLRAVASAGFDAIEQGQVIEIDNDNQLEEYIGKLGRSAAREVQGR